MNTMRTTTLTTVMALAGSVPALAVDTAKTYSSGLLIGIFLAFCALLVVAQLLPSLMLLVGFLRGLTRRTESKSATQTAAAPEP